MYADYLNQVEKQNQKKINWPGNIHCIISKDDKLISIDKNQSAWKDSYPQTHFTFIADTGHYSHIENSTIAELLFKD